MDGRLRPPSCDSSFPSDFLFSSLFLVGSSARAASSLSARCGVGHATALLVCAAATSRRAGEPTIAAHFWIKMKLSRRPAQTACRWRSAVTLSSSEFARQSTGRRPRPADFQRQNGWMELLAQLHEPGTSGRPPPPGGRARQTSTHDKRVWQSSAICTQCPMALWQSSPPCASTPFCATRMLLSW